MKHDQLFLVFSGLIVALLIHHYLIHGYLYDAKDFSNAVFNLFKSHEGLIVVIVLLSIGALICGVFTK